MLWLRVLILVLWRLSITSNGRDRLEEEGSRPSRSLGPYCLLLNIVHGLQGYDNEAIPCRRARFYKIREHILAFVVYPDSQSALATIGGMHLV